MSDKTCKQCKHWEGPEPGWLQGRCWNQKLDDFKQLDGACAGDDGNGVLVGPDFGCIHWEAKA